MIAKSKMAAMKAALEDQKAKEKANKEPKKGGSSNNLFFKAELDEKTGIGKYEVLLMRPITVLPQYKELFASDNCFMYSIPLNQHSFKIGNKNYNMNCLTQTTPIPGLEVSCKCPICQVSKERKNAYYRRRDAYIAEFGSYDDIPADTLADLKIERKMWKDIEYTKISRIIPAIFIKKDRGVYKISDSVKWQRAPFKLVETIEAQLEADSFVWAEADDAQGNPTKETFKPSKLVALTADKTKNSKDYYSVTVIDNDDYMLTRIDDQTIKVESKERGISVELKIPDVYAWLGENFSKWNENEYTKEFLESQSRTRSVSSGTNDTPSFEADNATEPVETDAEVKSDNVVAQTEDSPSFNAEDELDADTAPF